MEAPSYPHRGRRQRMGLGAGLATRSAAPLEPPRTPPTTRDQEFQHKRLANINHIDTKYPLPDWFPWSAGRHILVEL